MANKKGVTNIFLQNVLIPLTEYFKGVFSSDTIPYFNNSEKFSLIVNLSKHNEIGTHFIGIFYDKKYIYYFDSYGLPCLIPQIKVFLNSFQCEVYYNKRSIQSIESSLCGIFCLNFIYLLEKGMSFEEYIHLFTENTKHNDVLVLCYTKYIFIDGF